MTVLIRKLQTFARNPYAAVGHRLKIGAADAKRAITSRRARFCDEPIFVLGNQKSGTTAIGALLGEATGLPATLDLVHFNDNRPYYHLIRDGELPFKKFLRMNRLEFSRPIIKEPHLTFFHEELARYFPLAKYVMIIRDPRDNIRSILDRFKLPGDQNTLTDIQRKRILGSWIHVYDSTWMDCPDGTYIEQLAYRWLAAARVADSLKSRAIMFRYEDFKQDKVAAIGQLAQSLGLPVVNDISEKMNVQYQPAGNRNVKWDQFFGEKNLARINAICGPMMQQFGYELHATEGKAKPRKAIVTHKKTIKS